MNTGNIKKIVAREGLIVISVLTLLGVILYLGYIENGRRRVFEKSARFAQIVEPSPDHHAEESFKAGGTFLSPTDIYVMVQQPVDLIGLRQALRRDFPKLRDPQLVEWDELDRSLPIKYYYDSNGSRTAFTDYGLAVILVCGIYPAYWLARFLVWSIRTLRQ